MNIQQLQYIVALDKHRHFLRASEACFVTQATLSAMVKKLEEELNTIIFDRSKQPIEPTDVGIRIIQQANTILLETKMLFEIVDQQKTSLKGELKIGIIPSLAPYLLPLFLQKFVIKYPDIHLIINELTTDELSINLKSGNIDVGLLALPMKDPNFREVTLFYEKFFFFGSPSTNYQNKKYILPEDINTDELLLLEESHCLRNQVLNLCELRNKDHLKLKYQSGSIETLKRMVKSNMGCTILPELAIADLSEEDQTRLTSFYEPVPVREIGLMTYRHYTKHNLITALKDAILENIPIEMQSNENGKVLEVNV